MAAKPTRGAKVVKPCQWCGKDHEVRRADLNRGWGKYCSKRCKAMDQESRTGQNAGYQERSERAEAREFVYVGGFGPWDDHKDC